MKSAAVSVPLTDLRGTLTAADFTSLRQQLVQPMSHSTTVHAHIGIHRHMHQQFEASAQPISNVDKCHYLKHSVQHNPDVKIALDSCLVVNPAVVQQTFATTLNLKLTMSESFLFLIMSVLYHFVFSICLISGVQNSYELPVRGFCPSVRPRSQ